MHKKSVTLEEMVKDYEAGNNICEDYDHSAKSVTTKKISISGRCASIVSKYRPIKDKHAFTH